jgi:hypothetical protein
MQLRSHPLMSFGGVHSWPPPWVGSKDNRFLKGEIGILMDAKMSERIPNKCFLGIQHEGERYVGCVAFDDVAFCRQIYLLLQHHRGDRITQIGDLDLSHTL